MMQVHEFDGRLVCHQEDQPTFMAELWSWDQGQDGAQRNTTCSSYTLHHCDVEQALAWCRAHQHLDQLRLSANPLAHGQSANTGS